MKMPGRCSGGQRTRNRREKLMRNTRVWILGAPDPEMELIERLLRKCGESVVYATDENGKRVHPGNAYRCPVPAVPEGATVYAVECIDVIPEGWVRIDHHRPGDPGYGCPPSVFFPASSIGQVITELDLLGRSEERRVGKEGRALGGTQDERKIDAVGCRDSMGDGGGTEVR